MKSSDLPNPPERVCTLQTVKSLKTHCSTKIYLYINFQTCFPEFRYYDPFFIAESALFSCLIQQG